MEDDSTSLRFLDCEFRAALFVDIILYEMKIGGWFHEFKIFRLWVSCCFLRGYYFVRNENWRIPQVEFIFKIFRLAVSFVLLPSWISYTKWKLEDDSKSLRFLDCEFRAALFVDIILYEMKIGGWFHEFKIFRLWVSCCFLRGYYFVRNENWRIPQVEFIFKIFRLAVSFVLLPSWISYTKWKLEDSTSWV